MRIRKPAAGLSFRPKRAAGLFYLRTASPPEKNLRFRPYFAVAHLLLSGFVGICFMIDALFNQPGYLGAKRMLDATVARHDAIAANIANAETPRYKRIDLAPSFRTELQSAIAGQDAARLRSLRPQFAPDPHALPINRDGNTVDLERELLELSQNTIENVLQTQIVTRSLAKLRMAITSKS